MLYCSSCSYGSEESGKSRDLLQILQQDTLCCCYMMISYKIIIIEVFETGLQCYSGYSCLSWSLSLGFEWTRQASRVILDFLYPILRLLSANPTLIMAYISISFSTWCGLLACFVFLLKKKKRENRETEKILWHQLFSCHTAFCSYFPDRCVDLLSCLITPSIPVANAYLSQ